MRYGNKVCAHCSLYRPLSHSMHSSFCGALPRCGSRDSSSNVMTAFFGVFNDWVTPRPQVAYGRECAKVCGCGYRALSAWVSGGEVHGCMRGLVLEVLGVCPSAHTRSVDLLRNYAHHPGYSWSARQSNFWLFRSSRACSHMTIVYPFLSSSIAMTCGVCSAV